MVDSDQADCGFGGLNDLEDRRGASIMAGEGTFGGQYV